MAERHSVSDIWAATVRTSAHTQVRSANASLGVSGHRYEVLRAQPSAPSPSEPISAVNRRDGLGYDFWSAFPEGPADESVSLLRLTPYRLRVTDVGTLSGHKAPLTWP